MLLYNFFTESEAGNLWRIVSNYTEKDVATYYSHTSEGSAGVQSYEWDKLIKTARHLDFNHEQHKVLESELKILYTAITRARVNIFIAETDGDLSAPMFNYFKQRRVINEVAKGTTEGISNIPVFGKMSSKTDWRKRGESYLKAATGENKIGYLRLASKCFDKAGEGKRQQNVLAVLAFEEEQDAESVRDIQKSPQQRERLYSIATQLLEAEDIAFLDKVGFCLYKSGEIEKVRSASIFELYARLSYAKREKEGHAAPDATEQQRFSLAAQFYESLSQEYSDTPLRQQYLVNAIRNYLCSASMKGWRKVSEIIDSNLEFLVNASMDVKQLFLYSKSSVQDPISYVHQQLQAQTIKYQFLHESIAKLEGRDLEFLN